MTGAAQPWPPLIIAADIPRAVRWRDALLTLAAWAAFAALLDHEFTLSLEALRALGLGGAYVRVNWLSYVERLTPFLLLAAMLVGALVLFSLRTLQGRAQALLMEEPPPLETVSQAEAAGLDERELVAARNHRIVVVRTDGGGLTFEAKDGGENQRSA